MSPFRGEHQRPWIWTPFEFDLIFDRVLDNLRERQENQANGDRGDCIEWLTITREVNLYTFDLGEYSDATVREIREAITQGRGAILADKRLTEHPNRDLLMRRVTFAIDEVLALIDNHLARSADSGGGRQPQ